MSDPDGTGITLDYNYPLNEGIIINQFNVMEYSDKLKIEKYFANLDRDCYCFLDNNVSIIFISNNSDSFYSFIRKIKINNILNDNNN